ncbi:hypothetical protein [Nonomuraea sp. NPDC050783]|uniref:hypothetical protein n=1 Tax=Nonomuraea sp. NPDC050783 TaxID=3154634 RepID=UPI003465AC99
MSRIFAILLAAVAAVAVALSFTSPASASDTTMGCQVINNHGGASGGFRLNFCGTFFADSSYVIDYAVQNGNGHFTWTVPARSTKVGGCTTSTPFCDVVVRARTADQSFTAIVETLDSSGLSVVVSAEADIPAVCGSELC